MSRHAPYKDYCEGRREAHQFRQLVNSEILQDGKVRHDGAALINFASNDYLGLSQHPALIERARECAENFGTGTTASRLITGNHPLHEKIEHKLAHGKGTETALIMASGYQANLTVLSALADSSVVGKPVRVLADRLSHNSLLMGGMLGDAKFLRFQHNSYTHLEKLLRQNSDAQCIIVTESVFGMDGDCADLVVLSGLAEKYNAMLYVDEAHATGVYGTNGFGLCAGYKGRIDIAMGTFGKALGSFGAYIACNNILRDYLLQRCGGLIYSTALPPATLGAIAAAIDLLPSLDKERAVLAKMSAHVRDNLRKQGWNIGTSTTHIIPIILGDEESATKLSASLKQNGILVPAIRPPTVPKSTSRLRISLSAVHSQQDVDYLIAQMQKHA